MSWCNHLRMRKVERMSSLNVDGCVKLCESNLKWRLFILIYVFIESRLLLSIRLSEGKRVRRRREGKEEGRKSWKEFKQKQMTELYRKWKWNLREIHHSRGGILKNGRTKIWWLSVEKRKHLLAWKKVFFLSVDLSWRAGVQLSELNMYWFCSVFPFEASSQQQGCRLDLSRRLQCAKAKLYWHRSTSSTCRKISFCSGERKMSQRSILFFARQPNF